MKVTPCVKAESFTLNVLLHHSLQPIQALHDAESVTLFVNFRVPLGYGHRDLDVNVCDVVSHPSHIEEAYDVGHATQDHACGHQSFCSPGASHADIPPSKHSPQSGVEAQRTATVAR